MFQCLFKKILMKTILVSLISEQTIPNLLLIKEMEGNYEGQVFISTEQMEEEGRSCWIENAAGIEVNTIPRIIVNENNWRDIENKLRQYNWPRDVVFCINLTGGTKIMSLVIYEYFAFHGNQIVYIPIGKNVIEEIYPVKQKLLKVITTRLNPLQYLTAYGVRLNKKESTQKTYVELKQILKLYKSRGYDINLIIEEYPPEWKNYFTGGWFEEYLYYRIKSELNLSEEYINLGVELMHFNQVQVDKSDQEIDLIFTFENELYLIEAKVSLGINKLKTEVLHQYIFKLSAINKNFGLRSHPFLVTLADLNSRNDFFRADVFRKSKILGIRKIIDRNLLADNEFSFKQILRT